MISSSAFSAARVAGAWLRRIPSDFAEDTTFEIRHLSYGPHPDSRSLPELPEAVSSEDGLLRESPSHRVGTRGPVRFFQQLDVDSSRANMNESRLVDGGVASTSADSAWLSSILLGPQRATSLAT